MVPVTFYYKYTVVLVMLNVITSTYIMKLINFINLFYFQEEIIF